MNILVIDDSETTLEIIGDWFLEIYSINVILASSVTEGFKRIKEHELDLIICDFEMPDGNGGEVLSFLKMNSSKIPFIFFTGRYDLEFESGMPLIEVISNKSYEALFEILRKKLG